MPLSPAEFRDVHARLVQWMTDTNTAHAAVARPVFSFPHPQLWRFFERETLAAAKVVVTDALPLAPYVALGLKQFKTWHRRKHSGVAYLDTIYLRPKYCDDDLLLCIHLTRVVQWRMLGHERFLKRYIAQMEEFGLDVCPLEDRTSEKAEMYEAGIPFSIERSILQDFLTSREELRAEYQAN